YNKSGGSSLNSEELVAVARAVEYLGATNPQLYKDALKAYDRAISEDPNNLDAQIRLCELYLGKNNFADAQKTFTDVLETNPREPRALLGAARRLQADGQGGADSLLAAALTLK